jgi:hypothetical protein
MACQIRNRGYMPFVVDKSPAMRSSENSNIKESE